MEEEKLFSDRLDFIEVKLNKIVDKLIEINLLLTENRKPFLDLTGAASYLNISKATIYTWTSKSQIPHYKVGRKLYFSVDDLNAWLMNKKRRYKSLDEIDAEASTRVMLDKLK